MAEALRCSIIIPVLNEAAGIGALLSSLQPLRREGHEIIVVDGGSCDNTPALSAALADRVLQTVAGRGRQMRAGAAAASGDLFWFLHADCAVPRHAVRHMVAALAGSQRQWGRFDVRLQGQHALLPLIAFLMNLRSRLSGIATGDQGIFLTRALYEQAGGMPDLPLMEDIALSRELRRHTRPAIPAGRISASARRWERRGVIRTIMTMWLLRLAFFAGISPGRLSRHYLPENS